MWHISKFNPTNLEHHKAEYLSAVSPGQGIFTDELSIGGMGQ
jgi:hypothetical protein